MLPTKYLLIVCGGHEHCRWGISITKTSQNDQSSVWSLNYHCLLSHVHPRESSQVMKKGVFSNVHTKLNIWVSLAFQWDATMSEYNVSGVVWIKQAKTNHCSVSCMTSEPELQEISHCPSIAKSSRTACAFFLCWITYPNKQTRNESTKQILKYSVSGKKSSDLKQFKIKWYLQTVSLSFTSGRDCWSAW